MTESEAKTKWCPFVRVFNYQINGNNAFGNNMGESVNKKDGSIGVHCIASDCMAWRWVIANRDYKFGPADDEGKMKVLQSPITNYGYCGLAGE